MKIMSPFVLLETQNKKNSEHINIVKRNSHFKTQPTFHHSFYILLFAAAFILATTTQSLGQQQMDLQISNIKKGSGEVVIELYDKESEWLEKPFRKVKLSPGDELQTVSFDIPHGNYAISMYQDTNENGELDRNFIGIPKEPVAFGNNHRPFGEPDFESSSLTFDANYQPQEIKLYKVF
jgi:uncharacterized protein (DUF2141 family)